MDKQMMFLESPSGYMLPFLLDGEDETAEIMLPYGEQVHPRTGAHFFHHGVDFVCDHRPLLAVASGLVVGAGTEEERGDFIVTRYGKYQVRYCHISEVTMGYGSRMEAGQQIAVSGDFLHIDVTFDGEELNPEDFLKMLFGNISQLMALDMDHFPESVDPDIPVVTDYDSYREELEPLMQQWMPRYFMDVTTGRYKPSENTEGTLRLLMEKAAERGYFYQDMPSLANPLGLGSDGGDVAGRVQSVLIEDFLVYLASRHGIYLPSWDEEKKKKIDQAASDSGQVIDPLENLQCDFQSYDIRRICSVYFDTMGEKAWTKAWFNGRDVGEPAHPISRKIAAAFINGRITKDEMLSRYYPKQMAICRQAVEQTREAMMGIK